MTKELEALQILRAKGVIDTRYCKKIELDECLEVIEKALLELKAIKEAKPSKALEYLEDMARYKIEYSEYSTPIKDTTEYKTIKQALLKQLSGSQYTNIFIDEAVKPSEVLGFLEYLRESSKDVHADSWAGTIKQALLKTGKLEKAWEILKPLCEVVETPKLKNRYLKINGVVVYTFKTQEEFDLLKEMLCNEI